MYKNIYGIRILTYCCKVTCPISQAYSDYLFCKYRLTNVWNLQNNMFGPNRSKNVRLIIYKPISNQYGLKVN